MKGDEVEISVLDSIPFHHHVERFVYGFCVFGVKESGTFDRAEAWPSAQ